MTFLRPSGYEIIEWADDPAVKGADDIDTRPGFAAMLERIAGNGVRTIIVETANRFARDLMVQEIGFKRLQDAGIALIAADSPDQFVDDSPMATAIRQILGVIAQLDKAMTVAKLKGARDRKRAKNGKCEGRKSMLERNPRVVQVAKRLSEEKHRSLREIAAELEVLGFAARSGKPYEPGVVKRMLAVSWPEVERAIAAG